MIFDARKIADRQTELTARWHQAAPAAGGDGFFRLLEENHLRNFSLWHEEDVARRDDLGFERVYQAKRNIDRFNQERNNFAEEMDKAVVAALHPPPRASASNAPTSRPASASCWPTSRRSAAPSPSITSSRCITTRR